VSKALLIAPGEEPGARWATEGMGAIAIGATSAVSRNRIDVRRGVIGAPVKAHIAVTQVIGQDNYDIRVVCLGSGLEHESKEGK